MSVEQSWQPWRVALYLEVRRFWNSLRRSFQNPLGLLGSLIGLLVLIGMIWGYFAFVAPFLPQQQEPLPADPSPSEQLFVARFMLTLIAFVHLLVVLIGIGFQPYGFLRYFSESDLHFLFSAPTSSWRLIRALLVVRSLSVLGLLIVLSLWGGKHPCLQLVSQNRTNLCGVFAHRWMAAGGLLCPALLAGAVF